MTIFDAYVPVSWWSLLILLLGAAASVPLWWWLRGRGWQPGPALGLLLTASAVLALTLGPGRSAPATELLTCLPGGLGGVLDELSHLGESTESFLNLVLLLPFGALALLATRSPARAAVLVAAFPAVIELAQLALPGRLCSVPDYLANLLGGLAGLALTALVTRRQPLSR